MDVHKYRNYSMPDRPDASKRGTHTKDAGRDIAALKCWSLLKGGTWLDKRHRSAHPAEVRLHGVGGFR
jgi:hypothetical protein